MPDQNDDTAYFLRRAREEQAQAEAAKKEKAAAAHRELAMRYSVKALLADIEEKEVES